RICGLGFILFPLEEAVEVARWVCGEGSHIHHLSALLCLGKSPKINTIIMFCIAGGILVAMLVLMGVVICLYYKIANALKCSKAPLCLALKNNSPLDKVAAAAITAGSYPNLQCCDECSLYADFDSLPPCFCDINEGL
ncbi:FA24A protein, partial [Crocuta crocuta]